MLTGGSLLRLGGLQSLTVLLLLPTIWGRAALQRIPEHLCDCEVSEGAAASGWLSGSPRKLVETQASTKSRQKIPRLIHQCWFPESTTVPERYLAWQRTWVANHPEWDFWQWSDVSNRALVSKSVCLPAGQLYSKAASQLWPCLSMVADVQGLPAGTTPGCCRPTMPSPRRSCAQTLCDPCTSTGPSPAHNVPSLLS